MSRVVIGLLVLILSYVNVYSQTKIAAQVPESYKYDLSQLASKKERKKSKSKSERKRLREAHKKLKKELKLKAKLYKLKSDSLTRIHKLMRDSSWRKKNLKKLDDKVLQNKWVKRLDKNNSLTNGVSQIKTKKDKYDHVLSRDTAALKKQAINKVSERYGEDIPIDVSQLDSSYLNPDSVLQKEFTPPSLVMEQFKEEFDELDKMQAYEKELLQTPQMLRGQKKDGQLYGQDMMKELKLKEKLGEDYVPKSYHDFFVQHQGKLKTAQKTAKLVRKKRKPKEILKSFFNQDMKSESMEPTFKERLYIAGFFEIKKASPLLISTNPSVGYRFTERITAGVGGNYRFSVDKKNDVEADKGYAYQLFFDYRISPSFYLHSEYETSIKTMPEEGNVSPKVKNYFIGLGRDINYKNTVKASVLLLYKVSTTDEFSSNNFRDRLSIRTGFRIN